MASVEEFEPEETATEVWRTRVVRRAMMDPAQLLAHELNPHIHPMPQSEAMEGALQAIGWLGSVIVNEPTGKVIDGHMRIGIAISRNALVPVEFVDLSEEEEAVALATYDPIGDMRAKDREKLEDLHRALPDISGALAAVVGASMATFKNLAPSTPVAPEADPTDPGPGEPSPLGTPAPTQAQDIERASADTFLFGYVRWKTNKVNCTGAEMETLTRLHLEYLAEHDGNSEGFVEWLTTPRADTQG